MTRGEFIQKSAVATAAAMLPPSALFAAKPPQVPVMNPRWYGFNLTELAGGQRGRRFQRSDLAWMAEWGFNFARLPCSYWAWADKDDWLNIEEAALAPLDEIVAWGQEFGIHLNLSLHRIPGYCVNRRELEPHLLFDSPRSEMKPALAAAVHHWRTLAERYADVPSSALSFDLFNEPPWMTSHERYIEVAHALVAAIREVTPERLIVADGADIGQTPVMGLADLGLVQSTRGYLPKMVSHYTATWVPENEFESFAMPTWPMTDAQGQHWDRDHLRAMLIDPWRPAMAAGIPVHVGEWGCFIKTPHDVALAWMRDLLTIWQEVGWGWSMWNLRGSFGIVDSGRDDVVYENWRGHQLDRAMLELLLEFAPKGAA